jgi:hypothetical protein
MRDAVFCFSSQGELRCGMLWGSFSAASLIGHTTIELVYHSRLSADERKKRNETFQRQTRTAADQWNDH